MTTEVAEKAPIDLAQLAPEIRDMLTLLDDLAVQGTASASLDIMRRIITADSEEAIFQAANAGTVNGKAMAGKPFQITPGGIEWKRSAAQYVQEGAFPFYCLLRVLDISTGEEVVLDCGGFSFVSTVYALERAGHLDGYMVGGDKALVITAKPMPSGYDVLLINPYRSVPVGKS